MILTKFVIRTNKAQCRECSDIIESTHRHDFVTCACGKISVDGGTAYLRRSGDLENIIELSDYDEVEYDTDPEGILD